MHQDKNTHAGRVLTRLRSVDLLRGAVMVLMAIDHVRVYSGMPAGGPSAGIFFTRWVTNFCAPAFVFFAGTSAFLYGYKINDKKKLASYLITRGILLVILELTIIRFFWTFNFNYSEFLLAGVIWMLGWCMVLLSAFIWMKPAAVGITGLAIIFFQEVFGLVPGILPEGIRAGFGSIWSFIYPSDLEGVPGISILYVIVPWIGVMAAGYGFGSILMLEPARRNKICLWIGLSSIVAFLVVGTAIILKAPAREERAPFIFELLAQRKYPASQLFLLMTLGPVMALVPFAEKVRGWLSEVLIIFGKVPMFYYLLHILIIHISALILNIMRVGSAHQQWYVSAPYAQVPEEGRWGLPLLYLVFLIDVIMLYFLCRWYSKYKFAHPEKKWLKYI